MYHYMDLDIHTIISKCSPYTMISRERLLANIYSVHHINTTGIQGDIVEIGVWKGGSMLSMMLTDEYTNKNHERHFYLYDTFEGMTPPLLVDRDIQGTQADMFLQQNEFCKCICPLESVKKTIEENVSILLDKIHYQVGDICKNTFYPTKIAVLRLDTDWYESTKFELDHFYDLVEPGGIIIIDDYGHWQGCRKAVDEFLELHKNIHLTPIDYTGVYFIKPPHNEP